MLWEIAVIDGQGQVSIIRVNHSIARAGVVLQHLKVVITALSNIEMSSLLV